MEDRNVEYPNRYRDKNTGQIFDFEAMPGTVYKDGTPYNKSNVLTDRIAEKLDLTGNPTPAQAFEKCTVPYLALPKVESNLVYLLAVQEIEGNVQTYSNFFYELFYTGQTEKVGSIDNRYMRYTGTLTSGAETISNANIDFSNFAVNENNHNSNYQEVTISDGTNKEKAFVKGVPEFNSKTYTGEYPCTFSVVSDGVYTITMKGGKGANRTIGAYTGYGGKGGTLVFIISATTSDVFIVDKVEGSGKGIKLTKNGTVIAVVGGGGEGGVAQTRIDDNPVVYSYTTLKGGDGGGATGESGQSAGGDSTCGPGQGAQLDVGGTSYEVAYATPGGNAPNGYGGTGTERSSHSITGTTGGGGYAGGGGGSQYIATGLNLISSAGGGSSFLSSSYTAIENSRGTNSEAELFLMAQANLELKTTLVNNYTDPIIYRSNLTYDTTNHYAVIAQINSIDQEETELRILVKNTQFEFWNLAAWLETSLNINVTNCRIAFGSTQDIDESTAVEVSTLAYDSDRRQIRAESDAEESTTYAVIIFDLSKTDSNQEYIYKMLGVIN